MRRIPSRAVRCVGAGVARGASCAALLSVMVAGCGGGAGSAPRVGSPGVEVRAGGDHPKLGLVAREGDPFAAVAVAVAHDLGGSASLWLGTVLAHRLERATARATPLRPTANGFVLGAAADGPDQAARYVRAVSGALATPIAEDELAWARAQRQAAPAVRVWASPAEAAVASCVGELGDGVAAVPPALSQVEQWRQAVLSAESVGMAVVGPRAVLEAAAAALRATPPWPSGPPPKDPWPDSDVIGDGPSIASGEALSIAVRVGEGERALRAATALGDSRSPLSVHLASLDRPWTIERVVGALRPRGACVRVDLSSVESPAPGGRDAASVAALVLDETSRALADAPSDTGALDQAVLGQTDPRDAATIAAWQALTGQLPAGPPRAFLSHSHAPTPIDDGALAARLARARAARSEPSMDLRSGTEAGQGEAWMLLASPCATYRESGDDAGVAALALQAVASEPAERGTVKLEPWISTDGIGLLAHGPRRDATETPKHHLERIAGVLGRAFGATRLSDAVIGAARLRVASELSAELDPLWPIALEALAPKHPSLLDPRGTWQSVSELPTHAVESARRALVRGPLRLATLLDDTDPSAAAGAELELERWLRPERSERTTCPSPPVVSARPGEYAVPSPASDGASSRALLAVALPPSPSGGVPPEAEATAHLLNRPGGWLDTSVRVPGLAVFAEANVLGGSNGAALTVEITTTERKAPEAIAQARALFQRLEEGAATTEDVLVARSAAEDALARSVIDPRHRLVRLWTGRPEPKSVDLASLRHFHRQTLGAERHVVVLTRPRP